MRYLNPLVTLESFVQKVVSIRGTDSQDIEKGHQTEGCYTLVYCDVQPAMHIYIYASTVYIYIYVISDYSYTPNMPYCN